MKKKKTERKNKKNPALDRTYNTKIRNEHIDYDYKDKLSEEEIEWLNGFTEEYYGASLDSKNLDNNIVATTPELKKDCQDRNNSQNRCLYGQTKAGKVLDSIKAEDLVFEEYEDALVNIIDYKRRKERKY